MHRSLPDYEVEEAGVRVVHAGNIAGLKTLPIRFTPSPQGVGRSIASANL